MCGLSVNQRLTKKTRARNIQLQVLHSDKQRHLVLYQSNLYDVTVCDKRACLGINRANHMVRQVVADIQVLHFAKLGQLLQPTQRAKHSQSIDIK